MKRALPLVIAAGIAATACTPQIKIVAPDKPIMTMIFRTLIAIMAVSGLALSLAPAASAGDPQIEEAQRQGVIGERIDGYLGVVSGNVDPALMRKMNEINNMRRALYDDISRRTGTSPAQVARLTGEKQIAKAKAGEFVMLENGRWTKK